MKEKAFLGKGIRRVLSLMFCLAVCLILIPMTASAAEGDAEVITEIKVCGPEKLYENDQNFRLNVSKTSYVESNKDAIFVEKAYCEDTATGKEATELVAGHKYRLVFQISTKYDCLFQENAANPGKYGGTVKYNGKIITADTKLDNSAGSLVIYREITALQPVFITQPVGGSTEKAGEPFTVHYETKLTEGAVYVERFYDESIADANFWNRLVRTGKGNETSIDCPYHFCSGETGLYRLVVDVGGLYHYSDVFEITWGKDEFTKQPVGGRCACNKPYTITFSHLADNSSGGNYLTLRKYDANKKDWVFMEFITPATTSYDIQPGEKGTTDKYKLVIISGGGHGVSVYSDEFEVKWMDEDYVAPVVNTEIFDFTDQAFRAKNPIISDGLVSDLTLHNSDSPLSITMHYDGDIYEGSVGLEYYSGGKLFIQGRNGNTHIAVDPGCKIMNVKIYLSKGSGDPSTYSGYQIRYKKQNGKYVVGSSTLRPSTASANGSSFYLGTNTQNDYEYYENEDGSECTYIDIDINPGNYLAAYIDRIEVTYEYYDYFTTQPKSIYNQNEGAETNGFSISVPISGWIIERKEKDKWETFFNDFANESYATGEFIKFTCGYAGVVWPDERAYRVKVTTRKGVISYSEPFVVAEAIKSVEVSGLDKPVAGETLDYNVTIRTNPLFSRAVKATKIGWFTQDSTNRLETTVKAVDGQSYYCEIILTPEDGYGFEPSEEGKYVNGVTCPDSPAPDTKVDEYGRLHIIFSPVKAEEALPEITAQPVNKSVNDGATVKFSVTATGEGLKYQWQYSKDSGKTWVNNTVSSAKTATLSITAQESWNGRLYHCIVTDANGKTVTSEAAKLTVKAALGITKQPANVTVANGETAKFSVTATGSGLTYQWQYSKDNGATWANNTVSSAKTATLSLTAQESWNGRLYHCIVKDANGKTVTSEAAKLTVQPAIGISKQPANVTVANGETAKFSVTATGSGLTYQWQYSKDNGENWANNTVSSAKTATLSLTAQESWNGRLYHCIVKDANGKTVTSEAAKLTVKALMPVITLQPQDTTAIDSKTVKFSITAENATGYQWQYSKDGGATWTNSTVTSAKTATLSFTAKESYSGRLYRCVVTNDAGKVNSSTAVLTVKAAASKPVITTQPANATAADGKTVKFSVTATGANSYQWQYSKDNGATWTDSTASSAATATLSFTAKASYTGRLYRCVVTNAEGSVNSNTAALTVN